jgi:hypothetical protein
VGFGTALSSTDLRAHKAASNLDSQGGLLLRKQAYFAELFRAVLEFVYAFYSVRQTKNSYERTMKVR